MNLLRKKVFEYLTKELFHPLTEDDFLVFDDAGNPYIGGKMVDREKFELLQEEAELFRNSVLFSLLQNHVKNRAIELGFVESEHIEGLLFGKAMLYNLQEEKKFIERLAKKL